MNEMRAIVAAVNQIQAAQEEGVLVTLVRTQGSAYRRPGARMVVFPGGGAGRTVGLVSGGCLEATLARDAWAITRTQKTATLIVDSGPDEETWGPGVRNGTTGCHGRLTFLAERIVHDIPLHSITKMERVLQSHRGDVCVHELPEEDEKGVSDWTVESADVLHEEESRWVEKDGRCAFIEFLAPVPHLILCGAGDDAIPVAKFAAELGWRVNVRDSRSRLATRERFPMAEKVIVANPDERHDDVHHHSIAVIMSHRFFDDVDYINQFCKEGVEGLGYVGILGPRERAKRIFRELHVRGHGLNANHAKRIFSPIGLDLGGRTPESIALSIVAEVQAFLSKKGGRHLSGNALQPLAGGHAEECKALSTTTKCVGGSLNA